MEKKIKRVRSFRSEQFPHFDARIYRFLVASCIASSSLVTSCCCSLFRLHFDRQTAITHHESAEKHRCPKCPSFYLNSVISRPFFCIWALTKWIICVCDYFSNIFPAGKLGNSATSAATTLGSKVSKRGMSSYPLPCGESVMSPKAHGTCLTPVQKPLRWKVDWDTADRICCFNRHYAEHSGYWEGKCIPLLYQPTLSSFSLFLCSYFL